MSAGTFNQIHWLHKNTEKSEGSVDPKFPLCQPVFGDGRIFYA
jgi:hypothetical protein